MSDDYRVTAVIRTARVESISIGRRTWMECPICWALVRRERIREHGEAAHDVRDLRLTMTAYPETCTRE